ncbi:hypothetical protein [Streptomyces sp. bgisy032]|uniref:hypothetical protein n=1 Tax=Streptomyces sp. bgisy032 TaxID=3413773 RepID=UPI003D73F079
MTSDLAQAHQLTREGQAAATARLALRLWREIDVNNLAADWERKVHQVAALVAAGQLAAAREADPYLAALLEDVQAEGIVNPEALAGFTGEGLPLLDVFMAPLWSALSALARGLSLAASLASGAVLLDLLARTMVADAGRAADIVAMAARPTITSYVRVVELPACARCIVLAGREYGLSEGFLRHPRCDCTMEPVTKNYRPEPTSPSTVFANMSAAQKRKAFGEAGTEAIEAGADVAQVVNARRGMTTATAYGRTVQATREGVTRRGIAGARLITRNPNALTAPRSGGSTQVVSEFTRRTRGGRQQLVRLRGARSPRLMPEEIMDLADDRAHAIRLLRLHGYIV